MKPLIEKILLPVNLDSASLSIVRQVAQFAAQHNAQLLLLHVAGRNGLSNLFSRLFTDRCVKDYCAETTDKLEMLNTWKRSLEADFGIKVSVTVEWGKWKYCILSNAQAFKADIIALPEFDITGGQMGFTRNTMEAIIERSPCQVITFLNGSASMNQWKDVVIPITNFIPETRIRTIIDIARNFKLKIHLITIAGNQPVSRTTDFYYLTETLKRLKPNGNIQVECKCLKVTGDPVYSFLDYARGVKADILMTNMQSGVLDRELPASAYQFMSYV